MRLAGQVSSMRTRHANSLCCICWMPPRGRNAASQTRRRAVSSRAAFHSRTWPLSSVMRVVHRAVVLAGSQGRRGRVEEHHTTLAFDVGCRELLPRVEVAELLKSCPVSPGYRLRSRNSPLTELCEWVEADLERR